MAIPRRSQMRGFAVVAFCLSVLALAGATTGLRAPGVFAQASTPAAPAATAPPSATQPPAVIEVAATAPAASTPAPAVVETTATAAAQPATQPASTNVVTLVAWYSNVPNDEYLN